MWLSKQVAAADAEASAAAQGRISIGGAAPAVVVDGELRDARVFAPGGYGWLPRPDDQVLVLDAGAPCVAGVREACPRPLAPGQVCIYAGEAVILLGADGKIEIEGNVDISGSLRLNGAELGVMGPGE